MRIHLVSIVIITCFVACNTPQQSVVNIVDVQPDSAPLLDLYDVRDEYPYKQVSGLLEKKFLNSDQLPGLKEVYKENNFKPFFTDRDKIIQGLTLLRNAKYHGLNPKEYEFYILDSLYSLFDNDFTNDSLATAFELKLTKGILNFSNHLANGKLNPKDYHFSWNFQKTEVLGYKEIVIENLRQGNISNIESLVEPKNEEYKHFKNELQHQFSSLGVKLTPLTYPGYITRKGDSSKYIKKIKERLKLKGYYFGVINEHFCDSLEQALKHFQHVHSINADGVLGKKTYAFLNWTNERYVNALKVNLERLRWLPDSVFSTGILVNIPSAMMQVSVDTGIIFQTKLVVGKYKNQTPVYFSEIDYLVFNPCWTVPHSIAVKKMLPKLKVDSAYLQNRNMFLGLNGVEQETTGVDFNNYNKDNFPYKIYQRNGSGNALGKVKFMFHNPYSIYLHDTPSKSLFKKDIRTYSYGCVRVHNALDFADVLLYKLNDHSLTMQYYLKKGYPEIVNLANRIPISMVYLTCFYNKSSLDVNYCSDIYSKDLKVLVDLEKLNN